MKSRQIYKILIPFLLLGQISSQGQDHYFFGNIPTFVLKGKFKQNWSYNFNLASEINTFDRQIGAEFFPAEVINVDFIPGLSYKFLPDWNLAFSLQIRIAETFSGTPEMEFRPRQQLAWLYRFQKYRLRNRLVIEERFRENDIVGFDFDLRLRYRLSLDFPLQGEKLDPKEFYLNSSTEALLTPTRQDAFSFWESRNYIGLGYTISRYHRLEAGPDFRSRRRNEAGDRRNFVFLKMVWVAQFKS